MSSLDNYMFRKNTFNSNLVVPSILENKQKGAKQSSAQHNRPDSDTEDGQELYQRIITSILDASKKNLQGVGDGLSEVEKNKVDSSTYCLVPPPCSDINQLTVCPIDQQQVAIAGRILDEVGVGIWDLKHGVMHCIVPVNSKSAFKNWKLSVCNGRLELQTDEGTESWRLNYRKATLNTCVNKLSTSALAAQQTKDNHSCADNDQNSEASKILLQLANENETKNQSSFVKLFKRLEKWLEVCMERRDVRLALIRPALAVFNRFCSGQDTSSSWWPSSELQSLVSAGLLEGSFCQKFFRTVLQKNDLRLLYHCISCANDIPESCLVSCLAAVIDATDDVVSNAVNIEVPIENHDMECELPFDRINTLIEHKAIFIKRILTYPYNKDLMTQTLRDLDSRHILVLLNYLHHLLVHTSHVQQHRGGKESLSRLEVLDWIYMINLSHGVSVSLSASGHDIIEALQQETDKQYKSLLSCRKSTLIKSILDEAARRAKIGQNKTDNMTGDYCIRMLQIP